MYFSIPANYIKHILLLLIYFYYYVEWVNIQLQINFEN